MKSGESRNAGSNGRFMGIIGLGYWGKNILRNLYGLGVLKTTLQAVLARMGVGRNKSFSKNGRKLTV